MNLSLKRSTDTRNNKNLLKSGSLPPIRQPHQIKMNVQRRKKLGQSLTQSMVLKFNDKTQKKLIENEVNEFLQKESLTKNDLKELENRISQKIKAKTEKEQLTKKLISSTKPKIIEEKKVENINNINENPKLEEPVINQPQEKQDLNVSGMSGGSDLDKFDGKFAKEEMDAKELKDLEKYRSSN